MKRFLLFPLLLLCFNPSASAQLFEDFESGTKSAYADGNVTLSSGTWHFNDALLGDANGDRKNGSQSARIRNGGIWMQFNKPGGAGEISLYYANSGFSGDTGGKLQVSISTNNGSTWENVGDELTATDVLQQAVINVNVPGDIRVRIMKTAGNRVSVDDVHVTDYAQLDETPSFQLRSGNISFENDGSFNFGVVPVGDSEIVTFNIRNQGEETLVVSSGSLTGEGFSTQDDLDGFELESFETHSFDITFSPADESEFEGQLNFASNDPDTPEFTLTLNGETPATAQPISIAEARSKSQGTIVTVSGVVTASDQFLGPVYFQDETAGIGWYSNEMRINDETFNIDLQLGDSIVVTGPLGNFNNLIQIVDEISYTVYPEGNRHMDPEIITIEQLNSGNYEGQLVLIEDLQISGSGTFSGDTNYDISHGGSSGEIRISRFTDIVGGVIPNDPVHVTGIAGRFQQDRQLTPRFLADIEIATDTPVITSSAPYETAATSSTITFRWETRDEGHSEVRYGKTASFELGSVSDESRKSSHTITLDNLEPATIYKVQLRSAADADTSTTSKYITTTTSPEGNTGEILAFFNKDVNHELSTLREAEHNVNFSEKLIERIQAAEETADLVFYNITGSVGDDIADALIEASNRRVDVRVIVSGHSSNTNVVVNKLSNAGIYAVVSPSQEQLHNKFAIFDARHNDPSKSWIVTSSWNATNPGTFEQYQNMIQIQDVALARAYETEYNQLWGASSGNFNSSNARFSSDKVVVNPSAFWIGENQTFVQLFFSPQGNTEAAIIRAIATAEHNIDIGLNLITRRSLANAMKNRFDEGVKVRGAIGEVGGDFTQFGYLNEWADVHHFSASDFGLLHHKYAIIDGQIGDNPKVITGSHNWSANANTRNDENTLFIHSNRIANEYLQEFSKRYTQAGGADDFVVSAEDDDLNMPGSVSLRQNYPNPFNPTTSIQFELPSEQQVTLRVYDIMGRLVATLSDNQSFSAGTHQLQFDASQLSSGVYLYRMQTGSGHNLSGKMMLVK